ncbi:MFS transporter [Fundidesulfovibrio terrae]|uniref:MFS transporter n=1 Tax=Fundidesulfovibrio terrae TaxID=2922866 RepID=UPI001FAEBE18|nr:MFS transporter [Fundidesulfovibrio terrae]
MTSHPRQQRLFSFDFIALCLLIFFTYCNTTVFYSLDVYLGQLGIGQQWRGFLIGSSALATIASYLLGSARMTVRSAVPCACAGALVFLACGAGYLYARSPQELLALRLANGVGFYLLSASVMTQLVRIIPPERSGQAFGLYSVAILLPYSVVPAVFDALAGESGSLAHGYMVMSLFLVPALALILFMHVKRGRDQAEAVHSAPMNFRDMWANAARPPVALLLGIMTLYITTFSSVFFMAKGFFQARGFEHVGMFFTIQMLCMIVVRLLGNHLFDRVRKVGLIRASFALTAASCVLAALARDLPTVYASALVMGLGMGVGTPAMSSLVFSISEPRFKAVNSNLATMAQQLGGFFGPMLGAVAVHHFGYTGFLALGAASCVLALALCEVFARKRMDRRP